MGLGIMATDHSTPDAPRSWPSFLALSALFCGAAVLRLVVMLQLRDSPFFDTPLVDAQWHAEWAERLIEGGAAPARPYFRAPLYPLFVAGVHALGSSFTAVKVVQHLLGALSCVGVVLLGRRVCGRGPGWIAGIMMAVYGPLIYFENELLMPAVVVALAVSMVLALLRADRTGNAWWLGAAGVLLGLCSICRPNFLVIILVVIVWWIVPRVPRRRSGAVILLLSALLAILPVTWINYLRSGEFVLIATQGGINFFIGNNPDADGRTSVAPGDHLPGMSDYIDNVWQDSVTVAETRVGHELTDSAVSRYWFRAGLSWWRDDPGAALVLTARKLYYLISGFEIESNRSMYTERLWSSVFAMLVWDLGIAFPSGLLWPLAVVGACLPCADRRAAWLLRGIALTYAVTVIAFFVTARFKMPLVPVAVVFAGQAVTWLVHAWRTRSRAGIPPALALLVAIVVSNSSWWSVRDIDHARQASLIATAFLEQERFHAAVSYLGHALELDPTRYTDRFNLALAYQRLGELDRALNTMAGAVRLRPDRADAHNEFATLLSAAGELTAAAHHYRRAIELDPALTMAHGNLGMSLVELGDIPGALSSLTEAHRQAPERALYRLWLGIALVESGRPAEAAVHFDSAAARDSLLPQRYCGLAAALKSCGRSAAAAELSRRSVEAGIPCS